MKQLKRKGMAATSCLTGILSLFFSCTTNDVANNGEIEEQDLYEISDPALGEYLVYNSTRTDDEKLPYGTAVFIDGKYYLNKEKASTAENLYLVKNETQIKKLSEAGLATAETKIKDMDGLQYFVGLKTLKLTSNQVEHMDMSQCKNIETIEMNSNLISTIDLTNCTKLKRFRYSGSANGDNTCKLSAIDLSQCTAIEHIYLKNQNISSDGIIWPEVYASLKEVDLSGNPGAPFPIPGDLYAQLTTKEGVTNDNGNEEENNEYYLLKDKAFGEYLEYLSKTTPDVVPADIVINEDGNYKLNTAIAAKVKTLNVAKTSKIITTLTDAGLETADILIASADGLQYFTALEEFTATSNHFTEQLPLTTLVKLKVLQVNTAGISELDLSGNPELITLNCNGSTKSGYGKLVSIDLSHTPNLETLSLKNNSLQTIDVSGLKNLKVLELSGNPGADFTIPAEIYNNLTTESGCKSE